MSTRCGDVGFYGQCERRAGHAGKHKNGGWRWCLLSGAAPASKVEGKAQTAPSDLAGVATQTPVERKGDE